MRKLLAQERAYSALYAPLGGNNLQNGKRELLAGKGTGKYAYSDELYEAPRVLV